MAKFSAPAHTSAITFSTGRELPVIDDVLTAPDDLAAHELQQLHTAGFVPIADEPVKALTKVKE